MTASTPAPARIHDYAREHLLEWQEFWNPDIKEGDLDARGIRIIRFSTWHRWHLTVELLDDTSWCVFSDATIVNHGSYGKIEYMGPDKVAAFAKADEVLGRLAVRGYVEVGAFTEPD